MAAVVELTYYPVKGCAGITTGEAEVGPAGLAHDRTFMVVDADGTARTQRRDPRLALITPEVSEDGGRLTLRAPRYGPLHLDVDTTGARRDVTMFGNPYRAVDQGDAVAAWLSRALGAPSRLVRVPPEHDRVTDGRTPGTSAFADSCALLVLSRAGLDLLNLRMAERGAPPLPMNRFRPNIVLAGWDEPHTEDRAHRLTLGTAELAYAKPAVRCAVTLVDQDSGTRAGPEPLRTLAGYRRSPDGVTFGTKFAVLRPGKVSVGDEAVVGEWREPDRTGAR
ncbi:MOSC domain-containing protein [Streptomyces sp. NPDC003011]